MKRRPSGAHASAVGKPTLARNVDCPDGPLGGTSCGEAQGSWVLTVAGAEAPGADPPGLAVVDEAVVGTEPATPLEDVDDVEDVEDLDDADPPEHAAATKASPRRIVIDRRIPH